MIDGHLLTEGQKDKAFQMVWKIVTLVLEADLVFLAVVGDAESENFWVLFLAFLHEETDSSDDGMIEGHLLTKTKKDKVFQMSCNLVILVLEACS